MEPLDLLAGLRKYSPSVVHFSGHGTSPTTGAPVHRPGRRDIETSVHGHRLAGLCFQRPDGGVEVVSPGALKDTLRAVGSSVRLVVLNACYSELQAKALRAHVDCVIGTRGTIQDDAAIHFATGLYGGLAGGASIASAFKQGVAALSLKGLADRPQLLVRPGVDASTMVLADRAPDDGFRPRRLTVASRNRPGPRVPGGTRVIRPAASSVRAAVMQRRPVGG
ncbi:MAG TPA: CHAT domain-containing protein [Kofleriaceae bacterium]